MRLRTRDELARIKSELNGTKATIKRLNEQLDNAQPKKGMSEAMWSSWISPTENCSKPKPCTMSCSIVWRS